MLVISIERFILIAASGGVVISIFYIPKSKRRQALVSFIAFQATTWAVANILVQTGAVAFPAREFQTATRVGFSQNFFVFPMVFTWFVLLYPSKLHFIYRLLHCVVFISIIVCIVYFFSIYTDLEEFMKGTKTSQLIRLYRDFTLQFILCHTYVKWFFKKSANLLGV
ncbi:MAG TPA: CBO0543 family protein [Pseudobacteroides sp.]|uniref:CBO0543 family protein n=1 Tax=Pseudobacteroides sp. TaxID=1968840 RepID=UPI002F94D2D2